MSASDQPQSPCCAYAHPVLGETWDLAASGRVINGLGTVTRIGELLAERGARSVLVVTDHGLRAAGMVDQVEAAIGSRGIDVSVHSDIPANPSTAALDVAAQAARDCAADFVVAFGGGSALDAAKAVALLAQSEFVADELTGDEVFERSPLPIAAIPTTAGTGAETNGFGVMENSSRRKVYIGSDRTVPSLVIMDAELTTGLPAAVTAACGFDAVIHGAESLLSRGATTLSRAYATQSLRLTTSALRDAVRDGADLESRSKMMIGAHLAGRALTLSGLGLVHGIGHSITATTGTAHGVALASIARRAMVFGVDAAPAGYRDLARAVNLDGTPDDPLRAVRTIADLAVDVGLPASPRAVGVSHDMIDTVVTKTLEDPVTANTPRLPSRRELTALLAD